MRPMAIVLVLVGVLPNIPTYNLGCPSKQPKLQPKLVSALSEQNICIGCFASIPKQRVSMFRLNRNKQKTNGNNLIESIFWYFSENLRFFRYVLKQFCLFRLFRYRFETPKQAETNRNLLLLVSLNKPTNRNTTETDLGGFGLLRLEPYFLFFCFEETLPTIYRYVG